MIKRTIAYKDLKIMLNLYKTLVRPHVEYCVSAWSPHYKKDKELLEKVQQRFTKMIKGMKGRERLQKLNLWSLEERRNRQDLIEVFKGTLRCRLSHMFLCSFKSAYIWYNFTTKMILIHAAVI